MDRIEKALAAWDEGFSCAQSVFSAFAPDYGIDRETALKLSSGFGAGIAGMGLTCGAVTGAFLVLDLETGRTEADDIDAKERNYAFIKEFSNKFEGMHGSLTCNSLVGYDITTDEGRKRFKDDKELEKSCRELVKAAAEILEELLGR